MKKKKTCIEIVTEISKRFRPGSQITGPDFCKTVILYQYHNNTDYYMTTTIMRRWRETNLFTHLNPNHPRNPNHHRSLYERN